MPIGTTCWLGMALPRRRGAALATALSLSACTAQDVEHRAPLPPVAERVRHDELRRAVDALPERASPAALKGKVPSVLAALARVDRHDRERLGETTALLARQPFIVPVLSDVYRALPKGSHRERLRAVRLLGALRRSEALPLLVEIARAPLPPAQAELEGLDSRGREEMIQAKAVEGIQYLRDGGDRPPRPADQATIAIINDHPSRHVRRVAIDAYMFNHGDDPKEAAALAARIPASLRPLVGRPRFHRGVDRQTFLEVLAERRNEKKR